MNLPEIAEIYFHFNPTVFDDICNLNSKIYKSLFKPILKNNEINFFSWLSEMKFGIFFDSINFDLEYDADINNQTPDWKLKKNDEIIYAEVFRLNLTDALMQEKIIKLKERYLDRDNPGTNVFKSYSSAMSMEYFFGKESRFTDKEIKYRSLINSCKNPFILCVDCSEPSLFLDYSDFEDYFIGNKKGFFYTNKNFKENISGILIRNAWNRTLYLNNPNASYAIKYETIEYLTVKQEENL